MGLGWVGHRLSQRPVDDASRGLTHGVVVTDEHGHVLALVRGCSTVSGCSTVRGVLASKGKAEGNKAEGCTAEQV